MKATELKIGNLIYVNGSDLATVVCPAIFKNIKTRDAIEGWDIAHLQPIPLTEDWLLKFGFKYKDGEYSMENNRYNLLRTKTYDGFLFSDGQNCLTAILHVHQLQNLFYALCEEELTIKEVSTAG